MRAIARNIALIAAAATVLGLADTHSDVLELFASMTSSLSDDNPAGFMRAFDKNMPGYDKLAGYVDGLIREAEVSASIDPIKDEGDDTKHSVDLDWTLQIRSRQMAGPLVERQKTVHVELVKRKNHWRVVSFTPLDLFAPAKFSLSK